MKFWSLQKNRYILILLVIAFLLSLIWFHRGNILGGGDEGLQFYKPSISFNVSNKAWVEYSTGMGTISWLPRAGILGFYSVLEKTGLPNFIMQASMIFIIMAVAGISVYALTSMMLEVIEGRELISFIAAVFYLLNPYSMSQVWARGQSPQFFAFALLPLSLLLFWLGLKNKKFIYALLAVFASFIFAPAFSFFSFIIVYWLILGILILFDFLISKNEHKDFIFNLTFFGVSFSLWLMLHSFWLLPLLFSSGSIYSAGLSGSNENLGTLLGVSKNFPPHILIRLLQRTYFFDSSALSPVYSSFLFNLISWLPAGFLFYGLYKIVRHKVINLKFIMILFILGLAVSLGANPPLGWLFIEIFKKVSILQAFRNPYEKFGLVFVLGYSVLFAYGLACFFSRSRQAAGFQKAGITGVLILTAAIFAWPMWTGRAVAGADKKVGLKIPSYYNELENWLAENNSDYRVFMTPLWKGDGAAYNWNSVRFQGTDPMIYLLKDPSISNSFFSPVSYEFIPALRNFMERLNTAPALSLLRAKYLINRTDSIFLTDFEKKHKDYLTEAVYPPAGNNLSGKIICKNLSADLRNAYQAWIFCPIPDSESDWSTLKYIHIKVKTDTASLLDIALSDKKGIRIRWDGRFDSSYSTEEGWKIITIPLGNPTEYNYAIDFSNIYLLEVAARRKDNPEQSVYSVNLEGVGPDNGKEQKISTFRPIKTFGALEVYEPLEFKAPPEFGTLSKIYKVRNFIELFEEVNKHKDDVENTGFLVREQNAKKDFSRLEGESLLKAEEIYEASNTRFWIKTNGSKGFILLSKTFDPQWLLIPAMERAHISGNIFQDLKLLTKKPLEEDKHFTVNGYANLWTVEEGNEYGVIYKPQVIADIGAKISRYSAFLIAAILLAAAVRKYTGGIYVKKRS